MDLFFKFVDAWKEQVTKFSKDMIDANSSLAKRMVDYSEKPYTWVKETIKK